jgi:hypothetical protein
MNFLLTEDEVMLLTDYKKPKAQCRKLKKMGISFEVGRTGKPKVLWDVVIKKLGGNFKRKGSSVNITALQSL